MAGHCGGARAARGEPGKAGGRDGADRQAGADLSLIHIMEVASCIGLLLSSLISCKNDLGVGSAYQEEGALKFFVRAHRLDYIL